MTVSVAVKAQRETLDKNQILNGDSSWGCGIWTKPMAVKASKVFYEYVRGNTHNSARIWCRWMDFMKTVCFLECNITYT